jgi:Flp pilus assembly protein CpaB
MLAGVLLAILAVAGGLGVWRGTTRTTSVLVARADIQAGQVIQRSDLREAEAHLDSSLSSLALTDGDLAATVGQTAANTIHGGEMLVRPDLTGAPVLGPDQVAVTIPVKPDTVYPGVRPTDQVAVLATSDAGKANSRTVTLLDRATVFDVGLDQPVLHSIGATTPAQGGTPKNITVAVPRSAAELVASAVANSQLTIVLLSRQGDGSKP